MATNASLANAIKASGLKKKALGERLGITPSRFSKILHGVLEPRPAEKRALARLLKCSVRDLFSEAA